METQSSPAASSKWIQGQRDGNVAGMHARSAQLGEPESELRRVPATLVTETPVMMFDWQRGVVFDEVLTIQGGRWRDHVVLLDSHDRRKSKSVLGSCLNPTSNERGWSGTLEFVEGDPEVDPIWLRVKQRHLRGVSTGYRYLPSDYQTLAPGTSAVINGRSYRASPDREMRVVTDWEGHEVSVTPIQADPNSHTRGDNKNWPSSWEVDDGFELPGLGESPHSQTNRRASVGYLTYLRSLGLAAEATPDQANAFHRSLAGEQRTQADSLRPTDDPLPAKQTSQRSQSPTPGQSTTSPAESGTSTSPAQEPAAPDPAAVERERIQQVRALAETGSVPAEVVNQAIDDQWSLARVRSEFIAARPERPDPAQTQQGSQAPAGHVRSGGPTLQALQGALLLDHMGRRGHELDSEVYTNRSVRAALERSGASWVCQHARALSSGATPDDSASRAAEDAHTYQGMPMVDMCREILRLDGLPHSGYDHRDLVKRALSAPSASALFTTSFNAMLLDSYILTADTTRSWTSETDLPNWQPAERHQKGLVSRLRRKSRGAAPEQVTVESAKEMIRVFTFSERFDMTREDIFDDRLGGLESTPDDLGEAAAELRPDMVYATLLSNPNMADNNPIFGNIANGIQNLSGGMSLDVASLDQAKSKMATQKINGRPITERARSLIVPESKEWAAKRLIGSDEDRTTVGNVDRGNRNPAKDAFEIVHEHRLDTGVINPLNDANIAGSPTSWFLASAGGRRGLQVAYLKADGRGPITEPYSLTEGRIGMGWTIEMVLGVAAIGRSGLHKAQAASL